MPGGLIAAEHLKKWQTIFYHLNNYEMERARLSAELIC